ncbi:MAG: hypothetical protein ACK2UO_18935 [Caldilineaceae bacterium]
MIYLLITLLAGILAYVVLVRPRQVRWGATDAEVGKSLPGDEVVRSPSFNATRAVTIHAPCEAIWPWIVQIGSGRAGWYSIDWIDNARVPSAEEIIPELQRMEVGDFVPMTPDGKNGMWVRDCAADKFMLWHAKGDTSTWLWWLEPIDDHNTRLITRLRVRYDWTSIWVLYYLLQDVGDIVMMRKSMLGIKRRAEALASNGP